MQVAAFFTGKGGHRDASSRCALARQDLYLTCECTSKARISTALFPKKECSSSELLQLPLLKRTPLLPGHRQHTSNNPPLSYKDKGVLSVSTATPFEHCLVMRETGVRRCSLWLTKLVELPCCMLANLGPTRKGHCLKRHDQNLKPMMSDVRKVFQADRHFVSSHVHLFPQEFDIFCQQVLDRGSKAYSQSHRAFHLPTRRDASRDVELQQEC